MSHRPRYEKRDYIVYAKLLAGEHPHLFKEEKDRIMRSISSR